MYDDDETVHKVELDTVTALKAVFLTLTAATRDRLVRSRFCDHYDYEPASSKMASFLLLQTFSLITEKKASCLKPFHTGTRCSSFVTREWHEN